MQIAAVSHAIRTHIASNTTIKATKFITCNLLPPPKKVVLRVLGIPAQTGELVDTTGDKTWLRRAEVDVSLGASFNVNC